MNVKINSLPCPLVLTTPALALATCILFVVLAVATAANAAEFANEERGLVDGSMDSPGTSATEALTAASGTSSGAAQADPGVPRNLLAVSAPPELPPASDAVITIGGPAMMVTTGAGGRATVFFSGSAGQRVSVSITAISGSGCASFAVVTPKGESLRTFGTSYAESCKNQTAAAVTLLETGRYSIVMDTGFGGTKSANFALFESPSDVEAGITIGGPAVTVTTTVATQRAKLSFNATAGQVFNLSMREISPFSCEAIELLLFDPAGIAVGPAFGPNCESSYLREGLVLPLAGTYSIVMARDRADIGSATFALFEPPSDIAGDIKLGGPPVNVTIAVPGQNAKLTFGGVAGQRFSLQVTGLLATLGYGKVSIVKPDGTTLGSAWLGNDKLIFLDVMTLPDTGNYTVVLDPSGTGTGRATFTLFELPAEAASPITIGGAPVTVAITVPGQNPKLTFDAAAGQLISLNITAISLPPYSSNFCPRFAIIKPDGAELVGSRTCDSSWLFDAITLPLAGTYTIVMDPYDASIGNATFALSDLTGTITGITIGGPAVAVSTAMPGQIAKLYFNGTAGKRISLNATFAPTLHCPQISIFRPDGKDLSFQRAGTSCLSLYTLHETTLPSDGGYTIVMKPSEADLGSAIFALYDVSGYPATDIAIGGPAVTAATSVPGQRGRLTFSGAEGQRLWVDIGSLKINGASASGRCPALSLEKPGGSTINLLWLDSRCSSLREPITLTRAGSHTIIIDPLNSDTASAAFKLVDIPADTTASIEIGGPDVIMSTTALGQRAVLTFNGTAGQRVRLDLKAFSPSLTCPVVWLDAPNGTHLAGSELCRSSPYRVGEPALPVTGTYTIVLDPIGAEVGSGTVSLSDLSPSTVAEIAIGGPPVTVTTSAQAPGAKLAFRGTAGQSISFSATGSSCLSLSILQPDGTPLLGGEGNCSLPFFRSATRLPVTGTYAITLTMPSNSAGSTTFALYEVPPAVSAGITIGGPAVTVTTTVPGQKAELSFSGNANQRVGLTVTSALADCREIILDDTAQARALDLRRDCARSYFIDATTLPRAGSYAIRMIPIDTNVGALTVRLFDLSSDATGVLTIGGPAVTVLASMPGQNVKLTFNGTAGKRLRMSVTAISPTLGCPAFSIVQPDETNLLAPRGQCGASYLVDGMTLPVSGTYTIVMDPANEQTGSATFVLQETGIETGPTLNASSKEQGKIRLAWTALSNAAAAGGIVFRSTLPFDSVDQATRITPTAVAGNTLEDMPPADGVYMYRVASIDRAGTLGPLSNIVTAVADSTAPKALAIVYSPLGKTDPATGRVGQGQVNVNLSVNEPLQSPPYLAVVPQGGAPIPVDLAKSGELAYAGSFRIDARTLPGLATALFSARDSVGNRGTEIGSGASLQIDTAGPALTGIVLQPGSPIKNDSAQTVQATFSFSKPPAATPQIKFVLSGPLRLPVALGALAKLDASTYQGSFVLPADAGRVGPEALSFSVLARDDLDNVSATVPALNRFQVYQGNLPPLKIPFGLSALAQPGGKVKLSWQAVDEASSYQVHRQAPGQQALQALVRTSRTEYIDQAPQDGVYKYAVSAVRLSNGEESLSSQSSEVEVAASAHAPGAPQNLAVQLTGQGIYASWQPPLFSLVDSYNLYRAGGTGITSLAGLTPLKTRIKSVATVDSNPSPAEGAYAVTALDAAGNESAISNSSYLAPSLLPVRQLRVEQIGHELPIVSWTAPNGKVAGYQVYVGPDASRIKLTSSVIANTALTDTGYSAGERRYTVASVDADGIEMPRSIILPKVTTQIVAGLPIRRGIMNKLQTQVANTSAAALAQVRVVVRLPVDREATQFKEHKSEAFVLGPNATRLVPVIVGGYAGLPGAPLAQVGVEIEPDDDGLVKIAGNQTVAVTDGTLVVGIATEEFIRGGTGKVKLTIENTGDVDVELLTATENGNRDSAELRFKIFDGDGNVLAAQQYRQVFGASVVTLPNGLTVARIAAGANYVSDVFELDVPAASPDRILVKLEVDTLRYHSGQPDEVLIPARGSERAVSLLETAYLGEVTDVTPISSFGDQDLLISGRALDRAGRVPLPNTRLKLLLNQEGFERSLMVLTDGAGEFVYRFKPGITDSGLYKVSAVHPSITDRPEQKAFTINRITVGPTPFRLDVPMNLPVTVPFAAKAGPGTAATDLRLRLDAASQPTGQIPTGIRVELPAPVNLSERQAINLPVVFTAGTEAQPSGSLIFDVLSNASPNRSIGQVSVHYLLTEARPYLVATPGFVETGLAQGSTQIETVRLKNNGLQDAANLRFTLTRPDGSAAPVWASVASQSGGALALGETRTVDLSFMPPAATQAGVYELRLNVVADNLPAQAINVYVNLNQSGQGNVLFKLADIYTATVGKDGKLIAGLANARITVQNEDVPAVNREMVTDAQGEAALPNLPAGSYRFRTTAANHQEATGHLLVKPGITATQQVFMEYNLITVEWSVREISIEDRYEITLNTTYETDVPAPVVVLLPASVSLPKMKPGEVYYGELSLTNYGLVRADNVKQIVPANDAFFRYEFLADVPVTLEPKQRVTLPYRVISLKPLDAENDGGASGGGCDAYLAPYSVRCDFRCANGTISTCGGSTVFIGPTGGGACRRDDAHLRVFAPFPQSLPDKRQKCVFVPEGGNGAPQSCK